jgi:hypothetical protein
MLARQLDSLPELSPLPNNPKPVPNFLQDSVGNQLANLPVLHKDLLKHLDLQQLPVLNNSLHKPDPFPSLYLETPNSNNPKLPLPDLQVHLNNLELFKELPLPLLLALALHLPALALHLPPPGLSPPSQALGLLPSNLVPVLLPSNLAPVLGHLHLAVLSDPPLLKCNLVSNPSPNK